LISESRRCRAAGCVRKLGTEPLNVLSDHPINRSFIGCELLALHLRFPQQSLIPIFACFCSSIFLHRSLHRPERFAIIMAAWIVRIPETDEQPL